MTDFVKNQLTRKLARIKLLKREIDIDTADVKHLTFIWDNAAFWGLPDHLWGACIWRAVV